MQVIEVKQGTVIIIRGDDINHATVQAIRDELTETFGFKVGFLVVPMKSEVVFLKGKSNE